ncbi:pyk [Symbiodinium natans]|uniref:Pyk protein n=1 Tax=Symbiodinium natans TaxID=878477 RepID=A0A812ID23_9DINO|nr:pyk [Symbiodinium natans]
MKVNVAEKLSDTDLKAKVTLGNQGVNVQDVERNCAARTTKDVDAEFPLLLDSIGYMCVSFVQKGQDFQELIDIMDQLNIVQARVVLCISPRIFHAFRPELPEDREASGCHVIRDVLEVQQHAGLTLWSFQGSHQHRWHYRQVPGPDGGPRRSRRGAGARKSALLEIAHPQSQGFAVQVLMYVERCKSLDLHANYGEDSGLVVINAMQMVVSM